MFDLFTFPRSRILASFGSLIRKQLSYQTYFWFWFVAHQSCLNQIKFIWSVRIKSVDNFPQLYFLYVSNVLLFLLLHKWHHRRWKDEEIGFVFFHGFMETAPVKLSLLLRVIFHFLFIFKSFFYLSYILQCIICIRTWVLTLLWCFWFRLHWS